MMRQAGRLFISWIFFKMQKDRQFRASGRWGLASDGIQWVIQKRLSGDRWEAVKFIRSTKESLEASMGRAGVPEKERTELLDGLPNTFDEWKEAAWHDVA